MLVSAAAMAGNPPFGESVAWKPARPTFHPGRLLVTWLLSAASLFVAALIVPGVSVEGFLGAAIAALLIAILNAVLPPIIASLRLPLMAALGFLLVLAADALMLLLASDVAPGAIKVSSAWWALVAALITSAVSVVLQVIAGTNDDDTYTLRVVQRIARRQGKVTKTDIPGIIFLEIDGLALPVLRRAMRDGNATTMASWVSSGKHRLVEWEPDLSSQTGASQAGILLGSNEDIPAFRWVDKESGRVIACSGPADCEEIERERSTGIGLLVNGGSSRGNLLSGEADEVILTVSRMSAEKKANPGYRAFFANGFNVTRTLVLFSWELVLEWTASLRAARRDVRPRGHRGGLYPFMRAALCVCRSRPDRVRRPHRHDARPPRRVRDVLELRRGCAPLRARAGRHARGAPQARRAVRADRPRAPLRAPPLPDRRALRPRADAGRDVQAAERVLAGGPRRTIARGRVGHRDRRR